MEDVYYSALICQQRDEELRQKLEDAKHEIEILKNVKLELLNMLNMAYQERDEAKFQLQKLINNFMPFDANNNNYSYSSITESKSVSHDSLDSPFFDTVSSPEFSNINNVVVDSSNNNNMGHYLYQNMVQVQDRNFSKHDPAAEIIDFLAKGRVLPQKGKLLEAVQESGPLLHTLLLAGPLPNWRNPPPLQQINVPHLTINEDYSVNSNSFVEHGNSSLLQPKLLPSSQSLLCSSNPLSACSAFMLNFDGTAGSSSSSWNNARQLSSSSPSVRFQIPSRKRQRHQ
ncbi:uncharacterized protein LOC130969296 [Arachis stenosperma]|uniref:uncharacterized protein LOC130969296 n=1 Tax=Arachis stenosperma TaxID=217475 RepID=UPI0025AD4825|nr:uncharacterized protein LOC130969296 [Arachis stenosperma]